MVYSIFRDKVPGHSPLTKKRTKIGDTAILWRYFNSLLFTENSSKSKGEEGAIYFIGSSLSGFGVIKFTDHLHTLLLVPSHGNLSKKLGTVVPSLRKEQG